MHAGGWTLLVAGECHVWQWCVVWGGGGGGGVQWSLWLCGGGGGDGGVCSAGGVLGMVVVVLVVVRWFSTPHTQHPQTTAWGVIALSYVVAWINYFNTQKLYSIGMLLLLLLLFVLLLCVGMFVLTPPPPPTHLHPTPHIEATLPSLCVLCFGLLLALPVVTRPYVWAASVGVLLWTLWLMVLLLLLKRWCCCCCCYCRYCC